MTTIVDRSTWGRLRVTGDDRVRFLQGLTTINVETLAAGEHGWGAILNPKGRVLAVIDIAKSADAIILSCEAAIADKTRAILEKYAVMDDVVFEPLTGPAHVLWTAPADVWTAPILEGAPAGVIGETEHAAELVRIRGGFLRYGVDVGEDHFPFDTPLAKLLDYKKGCYVGQEPVFRVYAQGNAARTLRGLVVAGDAPLAAGAQVDHPAKSNAGAVTSSIAGPDGSTFALAYLHRTAWEPGGTVRVGDREATVHELPF